MKEKKKKTNKQKIQDVLSNCRKEKLGGRSR
jgi:hypothetical protein